MEQVLWAATGSEAVQKALWAALDRRPGAGHHPRHAARLSRQEGLAGAVTGSEDDPERDPRVRFISFPTDECPRSRRAPSSRSIWHRTKRELKRPRRANSAGRICLCDHRTVPGRRRFVPSAAGILAAAGTLLPRARHRVHSGRSAVELRPHRHRCTPSRTTASSPTSSSWAKAWATAFRSMPRWAAPTCSPTCTMAKAPTLGAGSPLGCAAVLATLDEFEDDRRAGHMPQPLASHREGLLRLASCGTSWRSRRRDRVGHRVRGRRPITRPTAWRQRLRRGLLPGRRRGRAIHLLGPLAGKVLRVASAPGHAARRGPRSISRRCTASS